MNIESPKIHFVTNIHNLATLLTLMLVPSSIDVSINNHKLFKKNIYFFSYYMYNESFILNGKLFKMTKDCDAVKIEEISTCRDS